MRAGVLVGLALAALALTGCRNPLGPQYEYAEQLYLGVDGSAELVVDSSIAALVALRNLPLEASSSSPVDRDAIQRLFSDAACGQVTVNRPWTRNGRNFVQVVLVQDDVRKFGQCGPVSWSTFDFQLVPGEPQDELHFTQVVGPPAAGDPGPVNWTGQEIVGFKLHVPSRVLYHNVRRLSDGAPGEPGRGNILAWEQRLTDRRAGREIRMAVRMSPQSILNRALWLFTIAFAAAVVLILSIVWVVVRGAKRKQVRSVKPDVRSAGK